MRQPISTSTAPAAIGNYSPAVKIGNTVYLSGQIPLNPTTQQLISDDIIQQIKQVFDNIKMLAEAANASLDDVMKLTVYLIDLSHIGLVNEIMATYFQTPFPARTSIQVSALPKKALIEVDAIICLNVQRA